jgi:hypothetical protein
MENLFVSTPVYIKHGKVPLRMPGDLLEKGNVPPILAARILSPPGQQEIIPPSKREGSGRKFQIFWIGF